MEKISICYLAQGGYYRAIHSFESIGFAIKEKEVEFIIKDAPKEYIKTIGDIEVELFVIDTTNDERTNDYFTPLVTNYTNKEVPLSALLNDVVRSATGEYICIVPSGAFVQEGWLIELIYYFKNIDKAGFIGIPSVLDKLNFVPLPTKDYEGLLSVLVSKENNVQGISFTNKQHFYLIGAFDESVFLKGQFVNQICERALLMGYTNFYIPSQTCICTEAESITEEENVLAKENLATTIADMKKVRNYYIPL